MAPVDRAVRIPVDDAGTAVDADLALPAGARALVVFAHGSGSSRHSRRNRAVAARLRERRLGTLLMDLLTPAEETVDSRTRHLRFDIALLAARLQQAAAWLADEPGTASLPIGYFGASTGAGAALVAAARRPEGIGAVVSRGGRPDLAGDHLERVQVPTLLVVGGRDEAVLALNRDAYARLRCHRRLEVVAGAAHLFEESGALDAVIGLAGDWFEAHLAAGA